MIVDGIESKGIVIPIMIPKCPRASDFDIPRELRRIGMMIAIKGCNKLENTRMQVRGRELLIISL